MAAKPPGWRETVVLLALWSGHALAGQTLTNLRTFQASGLVRNVNPAEQLVVVEHQPIPDYMPAMTMPFKVRDTNALNTLRPGDSISFRLVVSDTTSWLDQIAKQTSAGTPTRRAETVAANTPQQHPLRSYQFTNELGQPVRLNDFKGQALAITFFFTRCPIPDYCPRLSKNFQEACRKLQAIPNAPTNWHFLSVTFDPQFDTGPVLKAYGTTYEYDPNRWSFVTGPPDKIAELARLSDVTFERDAGLFNHNFRTLIIDAAGRLQQVFPTSGDLSDALVQEILKAAAVSNGPP